MKHRNILFFALLFPLGAMAQHANIIRIKSTRYEVTNALDHKWDARLDKLLEPYKRGVDSIMAPILGESLTAMSAGQPESLLGNWVADAVTEESNFDGQGKADFGMVNVGGLRNNMPKGIVRQGDIMLISPFENMLCVVRLKGRDVLELFRNIAAVGGQPISREVKLVITRDGALKEARINGEPVDPERTYSVATLDYVAEGNDKMYAMKQRTGIRRSTIAARDILMQNIRKHKTITSKLEGRITVDKE